MRTTDIPGLIAAAPEMLSIVQRWFALDGGAWNVERHAKEKSKLHKDTAEAIAKATIADAIESSLERVGGES